MSARGRRSRRSGAGAGAAAAAERKGGAKPKPNRRAPPPATRRGYNPHSLPADSEYHYGSDFGDESDASSAAEERVSSSPSVVESEPEPEVSECEEPWNETVTADWRRPSPEPLWLQRDQAPPLQLPASSNDLSLSPKLALRAVASYELLRRFRHLIRLTPFRPEDMCAALACDEQSNLLVEIHIALLKALLREEDSQQTHFGPIDHKDSVNVSLFMLDSMTWPEVLRIYVESDRNFDRDALDILNSTEYPFAEPEDRIKILEFLGNQFLVTNPVREDLTSEVSIHYDDHCRVCHRLGDLLCCETCPAVYHLECVDPPLVDVPSEDWQCSLCKLHRLPGVTDCISEAEKQGLLCRHEHLGFDRHGRKYWFICRRVFIEEEDGEVWYYTTVPQLDELLSALDPDDLESALCKELTDSKAEIVRQMEITDKITNQLKGTRKSYLEIENAHILRKQKERSEQKMLQNDISSDLELIKSKELENSTNVGDDSLGNSENANSLLNKSVDSEQSDSSKQNKSLLSSSVCEELKKKLEEKSIEKQLDGLDSQRLTRQKMNQIASGTFLFKLGNDNHFRNYVNQYAINIIALNKPQRNEERDKKRHLAHKFSLTCTQEFKWTGLLNASKSLLINSLRQTILQLETNVSSVFMHPNWTLLRKPWLQAVHASNVPRDFARALVVLQACIKSVVYVPVWHEQLGHVRLQRITVAEREERKKLDKREKKEKEEEEERNRVLSFVKYPIAMKHQIWKQKGEEYRLHGQWGWLWHSATRKFRHSPPARHSLQLGPQKYIVQVKINGVDKVIFIEPKTYEYLMNKDRDPEVTEKVSEEIKALNPATQPDDFDEIDIEKSLSMTSRIFYPKIAKKSKLDDFLTRRLKLKVLEERKFDQNIFLSKRESVIKEEDDQAVDVENDESENDTSILNSSKSVPANALKEEFTNMTKEIQSLRKRYCDAIQMAKTYKCYTKGCNMNAAVLSQGSIFTLNCYSPLCIRKAELRKELLFLLNKVRNSSNINSSPNSNKSNSKVSILQQQLTTKHDEIMEQNTNDIIKDLQSAVASSQKIEEKHFAGMIKFSLKVKMEMDNTSDSDVKPFFYNSISPIKSEILEESVIPAVGNEMELEQCVSSELDGYIDVEDDDKVVDNSEPEKRIRRERKIRDITYVKNHDECDSYDSDRPPIPKIRISTRGRASKNAQSQNTVTPKKTAKPAYRALVNRRFCPNKVIRKSEDNPVNIELAADGTKKIYSTTNSSGKVYLKRIITVDKKKKRIPVKYPLCSTFHTKSKARSILVLPAHELRKLSRHGGRFQVNGYNHNSKPNTCIWPYPCSRPTFKTCWLYRTINLSSLAAVCLQIRILWACIRWDDMATKPSSNDGKNQITTETEIISLEMLKHRHIGQFSDKTQYLRRKVVIPLEVPKTVREVTSIRSGLRKRKRAESPQSMEPQVSEEWVDEDKLELWEIRQYGEKVDRPVPVTRTTTGKLPPARNTGESKDTSSASKISPQEIKEKMEQQLRLQRAAHQQKRSLELSQAKQTSDEGTPGSQVANGTKTVIGTRRIFMTKNADGTTRVISQPGLLPKTSTQTPQSSPSSAKATPNQPPKDGPQKVQILRGHDGKITVRGLIPGQQLLQMPDGKLHVIASAQSGTLPPGGQIIATGGHPPTPKIAVTSAVKPHTKILTTATVVNKPSSPITAVTPAGTPGKVIIRQQSPTKSIQLQAADKSLSQTPQRIITQGTQQILVQGNQQILVQSPQQLVGQGQVRLSQPGLIPVSQGTIIQQSRPVQVIQGNAIATQQVVQGQVIQAGQATNVIQGQVVRPMQQQVVSTNAGQPQVVTRVMPPGQQIIMNNPSLAQQLAAGKLQLATINGQQVLIRPIGNNQALIVAHVSSQNPNPTASDNQNQTNTTTPTVVQNQAVPSPTVNTSTQLVTTVQGTTQNAATPTQVSPVKQGSPIQAPPPPAATQPTVPLTEEQQMEQRLLAGQPPGTVIKTVTAQVVNLDGGPRIVLQGLQGNSLTQQQLQLVQHQVKQQLLKAQEITGKQGMLGPTKLYLAVQPSQPAASVTIPNPPPLTAVRPQHNQISQDPQTKTISAILQSSSNQSKSLLTSVLINGQDPCEPPAHIVIKPNANMPKKSQTEPETKPSDESEVSSTSNKFVVTPDYIQQTIKTALKQENLNPEIEEKLIQLQKYQEQQMKPDGSGESVVSSSNNRTSTNSAPVTSQSSSSSRRRPASSSRITDDDDWIESTPRKRNRTTAHQERTDLLDNTNYTPPVSRTRPSRNVAQKTEISPPAVSPYNNMQLSPVDERRRSNHHSKLPLLLFRQKELLKKDIMKKRGLLEKELGIEIQKELSAELALRTKADRAKQDEIRPNNVKTSGGNNSSRRRPPQPNSRRSRLNSSRSRQRKKEKLLCVCRTPYDQTKFYVGCEHCNNWFHGDCVGITEAMSKTVNEFVCDECKHARDTQELYCLCRQPYDNSQFYICCDRCQDWFHGRCVGILQSEADNIDEYICPQCQKNNSVNFANMKELSVRDFENLKKLIKQIQMHKNAWPFMEPVDAREAPMYYKVIKEPMDLQMIENKINNSTYNMLSELIGDMTKIFDNCRYFNPKDSQFYRCAEGLEAFFAQKIKYFREKLFEANQ